MKIPKYKSFKFWGGRYFESQFLIQAYQNGSKICGILSFNQLNVFFATFISGQNIFEINTDSIA